MCVSFYFKGLTVPCYWTAAEPTLTQPAWRNYNVKSWGRRLEIGAFLRSPGPFIKTVVPTGKLYLPGAQSGLLIQTQKILLCQRSKTQMPIGVRSLTNRAATTRQQSIVTNQELGTHSHHIFRAFQEEPTILIFI